MKQQIYYNNIPLSPRDFEKNLKLPKFPSEELAYLVGVLAGDGNICVRINKKDYRVKCVGDPKSEIEFYDYVLKPVFKKVFNISLHNKIQDSGKTYGFYIYSKALVFYLHKICELPIGRKTKKLTIPKWIYENKYHLSFLRGLADTDFSLTIKKKKYPRIVGCSDSKEFFLKISLILKKLGFKFYEVYDYRQIDIRLKKGFSISNRIEINGKKNLFLWIEKIGFSNPRILRKIKRV